MAKPKRLRREDIPTSAKEMNTRAYGGTSTDEFRKRAEKGRRGRKGNPFDKLFSKP
jgi:hypothetical protein